MQAAVFAAIGVVAAAAGLGTAHAYTSAGDRLFPATLLLPQIAPGDEGYVNFFDLPQAGGAGAPTHLRSLTATYQKTITERFGFVLDETFTGLDRAGGGTLYGWQNFDMEAKYLAISSRPRELVLTLGLDRELGGTGARRVGAFGPGATTPRIYFGKGFGDLDLGYLRPLAIAGLVGYQIADSRPRPNLLTTGLVVEYSIPYFRAKIHSLDLPEFLGNLTPMTEFLLTMPGGRSYGTRTTTLVAPGVSYAGEGWELALEALLPASRATGRGIGVTAQFHLSLDFVLPETIGRPLFDTP